MHALQDAEMKPLATTYVAQPSSVLSALVAIVSATPIRSGPDLPFESAIADTFLSTAQLRFDEKPAIVPPCAATAWPHISVKNQPSPTAPFDGEKQVVPAPDFQETTPPRFRQAHRPGSCARDPGVG